MIAPANLCAYKKRLYLCAMAETGNDITLAAELLRQGKLVAIPTETVYGLGADALNEQAVLRVFEAKQRPFFDPLILHIASFEKAQNYAELTDERLTQLAETFWPGPLTLLLPKKPIIKDLVTSGLPQVALRVPDHVLTLDLLQKVNVPLAAPSANPFGYVSPTEPQHVQKQLGNRISYILDGGKCRVGLESTIAGIEDNKLCVFRLGGLAIEEIEKVAGQVELRINNSSNPKAPGQLRNHYAPKKNLYLGDLTQLAQRYSDKTVTALCFGPQKEQPVVSEILNLSPSGNLQEAALNLFHFLRLADENSSDVVIASPLPERGLGRAINDRLRRAAVR